MLENLAEQILLSIITKSVKQKRSIYGSKADPNIWG